MGDLERAPAYHVAEVPVFTGAFDGFTDVDPNAPQGEQLVAALREIYRAGVNADGLRSNYQAVEALWHGSVSAAFGEGALPINLDGASQGVLALIGSYSVKAEAWNQILDDWIEHRNSLIRSLRHASHTLINRRIWLARLEDIGSGPEPITLAASSDRRDQNDGFVAPFYIMGRLVSVDSDGTISFTSGRKKDRRLLNARVIGHEGQPLVTIDFVDD